MMPKQYKFSLIVFFSLVIGCEAPKETNYSTSVFESSSSVDAVKDQFSKLPDSDIWWTKNGSDMAWNFKNLHRIFPTVNVYRNGPVKELKKELSKDLASYKINTPKGQLSFYDYLHSDESTAMGVVISHQGKIIFEVYPRMKEYEKPIYWSVAKILPATLIRIYEERGLINVNLPIETYISDLKDTSFAGISIRNILDMATGLNCSDDYISKESCYYLYSMSIGDGFRSDLAKDNPYDFIRETIIEREVEAGTKYSYSGLNTFILAWLVEEITNMPFQDALSKEIWYHIGAEADASFLAPRNGIAVMHGGFMAKMRDMIRFGMLFTPSYGLVSDKKIISGAHINLILNGGNPKLLQNLNIPGFEESDIKHNVYQWDLVYDNDDFFKGGWAGQGLLINPTRDVVAVFTGYKRNEDHHAMEMRRIVREVLNGVFNDNDQLNVN